MITALVFSGAFAFMAFGIALRNINADTTTSDGYSLWVVRDILFKLVLIISIGFAIISQLM